MPLVIPSFKAQFCHERRSAMGGFISIDDLRSRSGGAAFLFYWKGE
jgi:hypothetical protein